MIEYLKTLLETVEFVSCEFSTTNLQGVPCIPKFWCCGWDSFVKKIHKKNFEGSANVGFMSSLLLSLFLCGFSNGVGSP